MTFALVLEFVALGLMPSAGTERDNTRALIITCVVTFLIREFTSLIDWKFNLSFFHPTVLIHMHFIFDIHT